MPLTYTLISSNVLSSAASTVTLSSIPSTYTDLVLRISARSAGANNSETVGLRMNGLTSSIYSSTILQGNGFSATSYISFNTTQGVFGGELNADSSTADIFGSVEIYIPTYTAARSKTILGMGVSENNTSASILMATSGFIRSSAAITSLTARMTTGQSFMIGSSFYLYGIKNS